ncbi:MAG: hypothetical protein FJY92_11400, partial [Candidatus Hydrogenedentes bacterium]|nr:hypothetical protein [Candidatus Hydrogenedentota bacterium]
MLRTTSIASLFLLLSAAVFAADSPKSFPVGEGGRLFGNPDVEALLARPYRIDVPMACTGTCLWAGHPSGWAFPPSSVHWFLLTARSLGFDLQLNAGGQPLSPSSGTAYPSHVDLGAEGPVTIRGAKWISADDVLVTRLSIENTGAAPVDLEASVLFPVESVAGDRDSFSWTFNHAGLELNAIAALPGFVQAPREASTSAAYTVEGEAGTPIPGSGGLDRKPGASGGAVLGANFGGQPGDNASWSFDIKQRIEDAALTIRYARAMEGNCEAAL